MKSIYKRQISVNSLIIFDMLKEDDYKTTRMLEDELLHSGLRISSLDIKGVDDLFGYLSIILEKVKNHNNFRPILHFESHGSLDGIDVPDGSFIKWEDVFDRLSDINKATKNSTIVYLACCYGDYFIKKNIKRMIKMYCPCCYLISPKEGISANDILIGTNLFYKGLIQHGDVNIAINTLPDKEYGKYSSVSVFLDAMINYFKNGHYGRGRKKRKEHLVTETLKQNENLDNKDDIKNIRKNVKFLLQDKNKMKEYFCRFANIHLGDDYMDEFNDIMKIVFDDKTSLHSTNKV